MCWASLVTIAIFVLASTVCVSHSAATGRLMSIQRESVGGRGEGGGRPPQRRLDTDLPFQSDFPSSSSEMNSHTDKDVVNEEEDGNDDNNWEDAPMSSGTARFKYDEDQPLYVNRQLLLAPEMVESQLNAHHGATEVIPGTVGRLHYENAAGGMKLVDKLRPIPLSALGQALGVQLMAQQHQPVMWPAKRNFGIPAEGFVRANAFDKRSPRCIAKCMQQGMVHPLQCHSLC